jgi:hypothetical protein
MRRTVEPLRHQARTLTHYRLEWHLTFGQQVARGRKQQELKYPSLDRQRPQRRLFVAQHASKYGYPAIQ